MPIDPESLAAFAGGGGPPPGADEMDTGGDDADMQEEGPGKFGKLLGLLEQNAQDLEGLADEFDPDILTDPDQELDPDDQEALQEGVEALDGQLLAEMATALPGVTIDEARDLANHLEAEDIVSDAERFAGLLFRIGALDLSDLGGGDEETPEEEPETEEAPPEEGGDESDYG